MFSRCIRGGSSNSWHVGLLSFPAAADEWCMLELGLSNLPFYRASAGSLGVARLAEPLSCCVLCALHSDDQWKLWQLDRCSMAVLLVGAVGVRMQSVVVLQNGDVLEPRPSDMWTTGLSCLMCLYFD